jgi:hypothetical protein
MMKCRMARLVFSCLAFACTLTDSGCSRALAILVARWTGQGKDAEVTLAPGDYEEACIWHVDGWRAELVVTVAHA